MSNREASVSYRHDGGTFSVARSIWSHAAFKPEPLSEREAFLWLVSAAAWKPTKARAGGRVVALERGELCHSVRFMASAWRWTPARVHRFLGRMRDFNMIENRDSSETAVSIVTVCNYDRYQPCRNGPDEKSRRERDSRETNKKKERRKEEEDPPLPPLEGGSDGASDGPEKVAEPETPEGGTSRRRKPIRGKPADFPDYIRPEIAEAFLDHRSIIRAPATVLAIQRLGKELDAIKAMGRDPNGALEYAVMKGWRTVEAEWVRRMIAEGKPPPEATMGAQPLTDEQVERLKALRAKLGRADPKGGT